MRLKLKIQYLQKKEEQFLINFAEDKSVAELQKYIANQFKLQCPVLSQEGFTLILNEKVGNLIDQNAILTVTETKRQAKIIEESSSEDEVIEQKITQKPIIQKKQSPPKITKPAVVKNDKVVQKRQTVIKKAVESSEDSESSLEQFVKKPNPQNALKIRTMSPTAEIKGKQEQWKSTFTAGKKAPTKELVESTITLQDYKPILIPQLEADPTLLQPQDSIQFKYLFLDTQKFEPTLSQLLKGKIISNDTSQKQLKIQAHELLTLFYNEIVDLEIDVSQLIPFRKERIISLQMTITPKVLEQKTQNSQVNIDPHGIGRQINFYYSDKNYPKDEYIQQHSAQDPEKCKQTIYTLDMQFNLLLNFPKIKKVVQDEKKLKEIIDEFIRISKSSDINFEIKEKGTTLMIRKRL